MYIFAPGNQATFPETLETGLVPLIRALFCHHGASEADKLLSSHDILRLLSVFFAVEVLP